jgi:hypothetical protein
MVNYGNSCIYKICCKDTTIKDIYVGSTTNFSRRKYNHKMSCNKEGNKAYNYHVYQFIRQNGGFKNWDMVEICKFSCENKRELCKEERRHLELFGATLNKVIPTRTKKEYYEDNKEQKLEYSKEYYEENKEIIAEKMKQYHIDNKEKILKKKKQYREDNKEKLLKKIQCECGSVHNKLSKAIHLKTNKHLKYINEQIINNKYFK